MTDQWQELKETIIELRDNDGTGTQQEVCKFLANYMDILGKQMQESSGDVVSKQAVLNIVDSYSESQSNVEDVTQDIISDIVALPPVNSQPCEDAISRQAVLDMMQMRMSGKELYKAVYDLPPVNLQLTGDLISRQSAISLASDLKQDLPDDEHLADIVMAHNEGVLEYQTQLSLLPPVTPQQKTGHWIDIDGGVECDKCGKWYPHAPIAKKEIKFCSECGAKMVEPQERSDKE